ncbi:MAG: type II secretion system F family protein [Blautia sp.]|nr:type II secretion system F family protein [Blautia sp.]
MKTDYSEYHFTVKEYLKYGVLGVALCGMINYLFYQRMWLMFLSLPVIWLVYRWKKKELISARKRRLNYQFRDALNAMSVAVQAGYSVENAVKACVRDLSMLYEKDEDILVEFRYIESQLQLSVQVEELFLDFGERSGIEDIRNFAAVFQTAKRTGGDMNHIIRKVSEMLSEKIDVKKEIEATLAAKKGEQLIMSVMPAGIILYLKFTSPGLLDVMYESTVGVIAMTVCLVIYAIAYYLGIKIVDIEV